jgi:hypothetical protein
MKTGENPYNRKDSLSSQFDSQEIPKIVLSRYANVGNCHSCFNHQGKGSFASSKGTSNVQKQDNS